MKKSELTITRSEDKDEKFIISCVVDFYTRQTDELLLITPTKLKKAIKKRLKDEYNWYLIVRLDGKNIGCIQLVVKPKVMADVVLIYILPEFRSKGSGTLALQKVFELIIKSDIKNVRTEIAINNTISQKMFSGLGFDLRSQIYYRDLSN